MNLIIISLENKQGIFAEERTGHNGADYILYPEPIHTKQDIKEASKWLRMHYDVLRIHIGDYGERKKEIIKQIKAEIKEFEQIYNLS